MYRVQRVKHISSRDSIYCLPFRHFRKSKDLLSDANKPRGSVREFFSQGNNTRAKNIFSSNVPGDYLFCEFDDHRFATG